MNQQGEQRLDQILFRWEGNRSRPGTGITAVAYSCERSRAEELRKELAPLLQTEGTGQPSQVRHVRPRNGEVVVINRRRGPDAHGRASTESYALIGSRDDLKARLCLTLGQLPLPVASGGRSEADPARSLGTLGLDDLNDVAELGWQQFTARVATVREPLATVAAQLLRTPDRLMSVRIPEFSAEGTNDTPLLIWGLCGIFSNWLGRDFWTYATYDTTDSHELRVMGVPHWRTSAVEDPRLERIALCDPLDDEAQRIAVELVQRFLSEPIEAAGVRRVLSRCPDGAALPTRERLHSLARLLETPLLEAGGRPAPATPLAVADLRSVAASGQPEAAGDARAGGSEADGVGVGGAGDGGPGFGGAGPDSAGARNADPVVERFREPLDRRPPRPSVAPASHVPSATSIPAAQEGTGDGAIPAGAYPHPQHPASGSALPADPRLHPYHSQSAQPTEDETSQDSRPSSYYLPLAPLRPLPRPRARGCGIGRLSLSRRGHHRPGPKGDHDTELSDEVLLDRLDNPNLSRREVDRLLEVLADGASRRTLRQAHDLGHLMLRKRLFLRRGRNAGPGAGDGQDPRCAAETAFWLLHWAVLPYVRHPGLANYVVSLIRSTCDEDGPVERHFLKLIAFTPAYGVPKLPSEAWWELVQYVHRGAAGLLPEPHREPQSRRADRRQARGDTGRTPPSDDKWRFFFLAMTCVAALLFLLFMLAVW